MPLRLRGRRSIRQDRRLGVAVWPESLCQSPSALAVARSGGGQSGGLVAVKGFSFCLRGGVPKNENRDIAGNDLGAVETCRIVEARCSSFAACKYATLALPPGCYVKRVAAWSGCRTFLRAGVKCLVCSWGRGSRHPDSIPWIRDPRSLVAVGRLGILCLAGNLLHAKSCAVRHAVRCTWPAHSPLPAFQAT